MKKFFGLYDQKEEAQIKHKLISFSNVAKQYINFLDVYINEEDYLHCIIIDDTTFNNKQNLVLIHGLGNSSLTYYKNFKRLSQYFKIFAIDIPGQGL
jgi:pimeloyl-ACP methyl ester carboxylesterase